jgi:hypothetical protein
MTNGKQTVEKIEDEVEQHLPAVSADGMIGAITRAELDTQIATARAYPRSLKGVINDILSLATIDQQTAEESMYALPRGGKPIVGPSVRLAEIVAQQWGNCRVEARVVDVDRTNKWITAEGIYHDLEKNTGIRTTVNRRIADRNGRLFSDDMIVVTGNAACSIARRNAIFAGVPKAVWRRAYEAAENVVKGDVKTLSERREKAIKAFAAYGVKPEQIFGALDVESIEDITLEHVPVLIAMYSAIKNGEETVESMFDPRRAGRAFEVVSNPLKDVDEPAAGVQQAQNGQQDKPAESQQQQVDKTDNKTESGTNESAPAAASGSTRKRAASKKQPNGAEVHKNETPPAEATAGDKPTATAATEATNGDKPPTTTAGYIAMAMTRIDAATDKDQVRAWFVSDQQRQLRNACGLISEDTDALRKRMENKFPG